jgi:uridine kinase
MEMKKKPFVVGICGGSGAGKTTLLRRLSESFGGITPSVFSMDNYYHPIEMQALDQNGKVNFDLPGALDQNKLEADLEQLVAGNSIEVKEYFFNAPPNKNVLLTIQPSEVIIVEGLFLFHYQKVFDTLDFSIFVDVDHETQLDRRIYRDQETRGYKRSEIIYQWDHHVLPCYQNYIEPYKEQAHFIFRNDHRADEDFGHLFISLSKLTKMELQT